MLDEGTLTAPGVPLPHPWRWRRIGTLAAASLFLVSAMVMSVGVRAMSIPPREVLALLASGGSPEDRVILWSLRLPRIMFGPNYRVLLPTAALLGAGLVYTVLALAWRRFRHFVKCPRKTSDRVREDISGQNAGCGDTPRAAASPL
jgi:hypothetical protein